MADPRDPLVTTTRGAPGPDAKPGPAPEPIDPATGQHGAYWVLTKEEREKGFVRPVRTSYQHVGVNVEHHLRELTDKERERFPNAVAYEEYPESERPKVGRYLEARQMKGCGTVTKMSQQIAETYARMPTFYGSTFCTGCRLHFPVAEFVWLDTDERVGS